MWDENAVSSTFQNPPTCCSNADSSMPNASMPTSNNRRVASHVFQNRVVSFAVFRNRQVAAPCKTANFSVTKNNFIIRPICVYIGENCELDIRPRFPPIKNHLTNKQVMDCYQNGNSLPMVICMGFSFNMQRQESSSCPGISSKIRDTACWCFECSWCWF